MGLKRFAKVGAATLIMTVAVGTMPAASFAEDEGPNTGRLSLNIGNDVTTAYMFRGIMQERDGAIWEPYANVGLNIFSSDSNIVNSVDLGFGIWASYHSEDTGTNGDGADPLYEVDYYPSASVGFANGFSTGLTYYIYTSPNGAFETVNELSWLTAFDDSDLYGDSNFSLQPSVEFAFETHRTSLGNGKGIYGGFGLAPNLTVMEESEFPLTLTVPLKVGISVDEYYYDPTNERGDDIFGFFSFGLTGNIGLGCIPSDFGAWNLGLGITTYYLGDNLQAKNEGDTVYPVGTISLNLDY